MGSIVRVQALLSRTNEQNQTKEVQIRRMRKTGLSSGKTCGSKIWTGNQMDIATGPRIQPGSYQWSTARRKYIATLPASSKILFSIMLIFCFMINIKDNNTLNVCLLFFTDSLADSLYNPANYINYNVSSGDKSVLTLADIRNR